MGVVYIMCTLHTFCTLTLSEKKMAMKYESYHFINSISNITVKSSTM